MVVSKYLAILWASRREALYRPFSSEMMVCRVTATASASSAWEIRRSFRRAAIRFSIGSLLTARTGCAGMDSLLWGLM